MASKQYIKKLKTDIERTIQGFQKYKNLKNHESVAEHVKDVNQKLD